MKKNKIVKPFSFILIFLVLLTACGSEKKESRFDEYTQYWQTQQYEKMYGMLSQSSKDYISEEDFVGGHTTIYEAINASDIEIGELHRH